MAKKPLKPTCPSSTRHTLLDRLEQELRKGDSAGAHAVLDEWDTYRQPAWRPGARFPSKLSVVGMLTQCSVDSSVRDRISQGANLTNSWTWKSLSDSGVPDPSVWDWLSTQCVPDGLEVFWMAAPNSKTKSADSIDPKDVFLVRFPSAAGVSGRLSPPKRLMVAPSTASTYRLLGFPSASEPPEPVPMNSLLLSGVSSAYSLFGVERKKLPKDHPLVVLSDILDQSEFTEALRRSIETKAPAGTFVALDLADVHRRSRLRWLTSRSWRSAARAPLIAKYAMRACLPQGLLDPDLLRRFSTAIAEHFVASAMWGENKWPAGDRDSLYRGTGDLLPSSHKTSRFSNLIWSPLTELNVYLSASGALGHEAASEDPEDGESAKDAKDISPPDGGVSDIRRIGGGMVYQWLTHLLDEVLAGKAPKNDPETYMLKVQDMLLDRAAEACYTQEVSAILLGQVVRAALFMPSLEADPRRISMRTYREDIAAWRRLVEMRPEIKDGWDFLERTRKDFVTRAATHAAAAQKKFPSLIDADQLFDTLPVSSPSSQVVFRTSVREKMRTLLGVPVADLNRSMGHFVSLAAVKDVEGLGLPRFSSMGSLFLPVAQGYSSSLLSVNMSDPWIGRKMAVAGLALIDDDEKQAYPMTMGFSAFAAPSFNHLLVQCGHAAVIDLVHSPEGLKEFRAILDSNPSVERAWWARASAETLRAVFRADSTLANRRDAFGNTPVHWALLGDIISVPVESWSSLALSQCSKTKAQVLVTHAREACLEANQAGVVPADAANFLPPVQAVLQRALMKSVVHSGAEGRARTTKKSKETRAAHAVGLEFAPKRRM